MRYLKIVTFLSALVISSAAFANIPVNEEKFTYVQQSSSENAILQGIVACAVFYDVAIEHFDQMYPYVKDYMNDEQKRKYQITLVLLRFHWYENILLHSMLIGRNGFGDYISRYTELRDELLAAANSQENVLIELIGKCNELTTQMNRGSNSSR